MARFLTQRLQLIKSLSQVRYDCTYDHRWAAQCREVVGYGTNNRTPYIDLPEFPFPKVRWEEPTPEILALRKKEMGDWRQLSQEEKKTLYRYSFRQTFAEMKAPTGEWKLVVGIFLMLLSLGIWMNMGIVKLVYRQVDYPITMSEDYQRAQLRRMLDLQVGIIDGLSSKWDYEKGKWK